MNHEIKRATGLLVLEAVNSNPNGDPDRDGEPRQRDNGRGEISPVSFKRKLRDLIEQNDKDEHDTPFFKALPEKFSGKEHEKQCVNYGQRVQNSVFECILDAAQCRQLQHKLCSLMDKEKDSLRFYYLGNRYEAKVEHFGINAGYQPEGVLMV